MGKKTTWKLGKQSAVSYKTMLSNRKFQLYYPLQGDDKLVKIQLNKHKMPPEFRSVYKEIAFNKRTAMKMCSKETDLDILLVFNSTIPNNFFGPKRHRGIFTKILKLIVTRSMHECIFLSNLSSGYNLDDVPWLSRVKNKSKYFTLGIRRVLNNIILPMFRKLYYPLPMGQNYEIKFVRKNLWSHYLNKVTNHLLKEKYMKPLDCANKNLCRGLLQIKPKNGLREWWNFRAYARVNRNHISKVNKKQINTYIFNYARKICSTKIDKLYQHWCEYLEQIKDKQIYGVKLDLSDCFGNVDLGVLKDIINESTNTDIPIKHKKYLIDLISNQYVLFGRKRVGKTKEYKVWKWDHGLLQGDRFSAPLCELYISYLDGKYLNDFKNKWCFLHRKVDDYFFCSTYEIDILNFIEVVAKFAPINKEKMQTNLFFQQDRIEYCGHIIDMNSREVKGSYKFETNTKLHGRFKLWNKSAQINFQGLLAKSLFYPYNNFRFGKINLNLQFNNPQTVLDNYFEAMVLLAFKFDYAVASGSGEKKLKDTLHQFISDAVWFYAIKFMKKMKRGAKWICVPIKIGYCAFRVVLLRRGTPIYKEIAAEITKIANRIYVKDFDCRGYYKIPKAFENIAMKREFTPLCS